MICPNVEFNPLSSVLGVLHVLEEGKVELRLGDA